MSDIDLEYLIELADRAASYWRSIAEAAERGECLTLVRHCRQAGAVTCEAFELVKTIGAEVTP